MATATNLREAAGQAYDNLFVRWNTGQLKVRLGNYCLAVAVLFPDSNDRTRPVGNWLIPMQALHQQMPNAPALASLAQLNLAAQQVYRQCYLAYSMNAAGLVTAPEAAALLLEYNGFF